MFRVFLKARDFAEVRKLNTALALKLRDLGRGFRLQRLFVLFLCGFLRPRRLFQRLACLARLSLNALFLEYHGKVGVAPLVNRALADLLFKLGRQFGFGLFLQLCLHRQVGLFCLFASRALLALFCLCFPACGGILRILFFRLHPFLCNRLFVLLCVVCLVRVVELGVLKAFFGLEVVNLIKFRYFILHDRILGTV